VGVVLAAVIKAKKKQFNFICTNQSARAQKHSLFLDSELMSAYFIVSLDVELQWGYKLYPESQMARLLQHNEHKAINAVDNLLRLFEKFEVPATWAIVGKLFFEHPEILANIRESEVEHEIGYHSFSHIRFSDASRVTAQVEFEEGLKIQDEFGVNFRSFVFPENEIGHVDLLPQYGFVIYRGPNCLFKSANKSLLSRAKNVALNKLIARPVEPRWKDTIWEIPSSMMFHDMSRFQAHIFKANRGIKKAIAANSTFHLFFHPENILLEPKLLGRFERVLRLVKAEAEKKELCPITMGDFAKVAARSH
jgi:peptidoglycan/xylan/chitin deacetylase (PgdA/CDA1 family)